MNSTYINVLIGLFLGMIMHNMGFFSIIEGLNSEQEKDCNNTKNIISKNSAAISTVKAKLESLEKWLKDIATSGKKNTERNKLNRDNIKRTIMVVKQGVNDKEKELEKAGEGL